MIRTVVGQTVIDDRLPFRITLIIQRHDQPVRTGLGLGQCVCRLVVHEQYRAGANVHVDTAQRSREGRLVIGVRLDRLVHQYRP